MKSTLSTLLLATVASVAAVFAAETATTPEAAAKKSVLNAVVNGLPAGTTEVVVLLDSVLPPTPPEEYEDATPPAAAAAAAAAGKAAAGKAAPAAQPGAPKAAPAPRRRRPEAPPPPPVYRKEIAVNGETSVTLPFDVPVGKYYRVRAVALKGDGMYPSVLAGGLLDGLEVVESKPTEAPVSLTAPKVELAPVTPASVATGSAFNLAGTITDPAGMLGTKNRMRVWVSPGAPLGENYGGTQTSTTDVTTEGQKITFHFDLNAPAEPTTLYFQFGEISNEFVREDRRRAPFLVAPDISAGAQSLSIRVENR